MEMKSPEQQAVKTTVFFDRSLLDEIDRENPFSTRREFLDRASREYLEKLRRREIDEQLASACAEAAEEDLLENEAWEPITLETWT
jgi:metal-responsive CopG/Arc/MetJ family transcriptional regulator